MSMRRSSIPTPIMKIREVIKEIRFDTGKEKVPQAVLKRIVSCMEVVVDNRSQGMIEYPLPYILLLSFLAVLSGAEGWEDMQVFAESYKTKLNAYYQSTKI